MDKPFLMPKVDLVFKRIMENDIVLTGFLGAVLRLAPEAIGKPVHLDTHLLPEFPGDKMGILDVRVQLQSEQEVDIEIQLAPYRYWTDRSLFYLSDMFVRQLKAGVPYSNLIKCVSIAILDFVCFKETPQFYSRFHILEDTRHFRFSDMFELHTLELPKLPTEMASSRMRDPLYQWARFFDAETYEEVKELSQINPSIQEAIAELDRMASDPNLRAAYQNRKMALLDEISRQDELEHGIERAEKRGIKIGEVRTNEKNAISMLEKGLSIDLIMEITHLSEERIHQLAQERQRS